MSIETFVLVLCIGAAALALWVVVRFPDFGPTEVTRALLHVAISIVLAQATLPAIHLVTGVPGARFIASFGIVLPSLTYMFLAAAWMIRALGSRLQGGF